MRKAVQLAGLARAAVASGQLAGGALAGPSQQLALAQAGVISRSYAGGGVPEEDPYHVIHNPTLLQKVAPLIFKTPFKLLRAAVSGAKAGVIGLAHSGPVKSLVTSVGDSLVVHEKIWELKDLDVAYWAYTLTQSGYSDKAGVQKMVNAAKAQVCGLRVPLRGRRRRAAAPRSRLARPGGRTILLSPTPSA